MDVHTLAGSGDALALHVVVNIRLVAVDNRRTDASDAVAIDAVTT